MVIRLRLNVQREAGAISHDQLWVPFGAYHRGRLANEHRSIDETLISSQKDDFSHYETNRLILEHGTVTA